MNWLTDIKYMGLLALVIGLFGGGWYLGGLKSKEALEAYKAATATNTATQESTQLVTAEKADQVHDDEITAIRLNVVNTPVYVRVPVRPSVPLPTNPPSPNQPSGGTDSGFRESDIRPAITAIELKYEGELADCRRIIATWPK